MTRNNETEIGGKTHGQETASESSVEARDGELDELLAPLQAVEPSAAVIEDWQKMVRTNPLFADPASRQFRAQPVGISRRIIEWAVAASIGFAVGAYFMNRNEVPKTAFQAPAENIGEMDATEMVLVAKSL
jgi:hypothetical protein